MFRTLISVLKLMKILKNNEVKKWIALKITNENIENQNVQPTKHWIYYSQNIESFKKNQFF